MSCWSSSGSACSSLARAFVQVPAHQRQIPKREQRPRHARAILNRLRDYQATVGQRRSSLQIAFVHRDKAQPTTGSCDPWLVAICV